jgi:hypothetical protein
MEAIDRRPIATRNRKWAQAATAWLASRNVKASATRDDQASDRRCAPVCINSQPSGRLVANRREG